MGPEVAIGCRSPRLVLGGVLPAGRTSQRVVLGSGRAVSARVTPTDVLPGRRGWTYAPPADEAVRRLVGGQGLGQGALGVPPARVACAVGGPKPLIQPRPDGADDARQRRGLARPAPGPAGTIGTAGGEPLLAADGPLGTLCVALGQAPTLGDCIAPPPGFGVTSTGTYRAPGDATLVVRRTAPDVPAVAISSYDGPGTSVATAPAAGSYAGAYAGRLRTFSGTLPAGRELAGTQRTTPGVPVPTASKAGILAILESLDPDQPVRRRASLGGGLSLWTIRQRGFTCARISATRPVPAEHDCDVPTYPTLRLAVPCRPQRTAVSVVLPARGARLEVTDGDGHRHVGRPVVLDRGRVLHAVVLASEDRVARVRVTAGGHRSDVSLRGLVAARAQCGYDADTTLVPRD